MGAEQKRMRILHSLKSSFLLASEKDKGLIRADLISEICMNHGVVKQKAEEYLKVLLDAKFIEEDKFGLWLVKKTPILTNGEKDDLPADKLLEGLGNEN